jgi:hypothetical protein
VMKWDGVRVTASSRFTYRLNRRDEQRIDTTIRVIRDEGGDAASTHSRPRTLQWPIESGDKTRCRTNRLRR